MKTIATIEARMSSSRLPGKVLKPILGRPTLEELRMDLRAMLKKVRADFTGPIG